MECLAYIISITLTATISKMKLQDERLSRILQPQLQVQEYIFLY